MRRCLACMVLAIFARPYGQRAYAFSPGKSIPRHRAGRTRRSRVAWTKPRRGSAADLQGLEEAVEALLPEPEHRLRSPAEALRRGEWFKLICGASFEDLPAVRNLATVFTLAGADCMDVAAEEAVIESAREGIHAALAVATGLGVTLREPWLMMSVNDDEDDPHFRKAFFDPGFCPQDCPRPCEKVCPADAIVFPDSPLPPPRRAAMVREHLEEKPSGGVLDARCYGCGRCIDVCPLGLVGARSYRRRPGDVVRLLGSVDALEVHTKGHAEHFQELWGAVGPVAGEKLRAVAVSFPDLGEETGAAVSRMNAVLQQKGQKVRGLNIWQTDGRPMSGDIGAGATSACVRLAQKVLATGAVPFGEGGHFVQLAGGTNQRTVPKLQELGLLPAMTPKPSLQALAGEPADARRWQEGGEGEREGGAPVAAAAAGGGGGGGGGNRRAVSRAELLGSQGGVGGAAPGLGGVAYGGYARKAVAVFLDSLQEGSPLVEDHPEVLLAALAEARRLVAPLKRSGAPPGLLC